MGRFFQAQPTQFLDDAMYQHPVDLMKEALLTKEKRAQETMSLIEGLDDELQINPHYKDREEAKRIRDNINFKINELSDKLYKDPDMSLGLRNKIRKVEQDLMESEQQGEIYRINKNKQQIDEQKKAIREQYRKDPSRYGFLENAEQADSLVDHYYTGVRDQEGNLKDAEQTSLKGRDSKYDTAIAAIKNKVGGKTSFESSMVDDDGNPTGLMKKFTYEGFDETDLNETIESYVDGNEEIQGSLLQEFEVRKMRDPSVTYKKVKEEYLNGVKEIAKDQFEKTLTGTNITGSRSSGGSGKTTDSGLSGLRTTEFERVVVNDLVPQRTSGSDLKEFQTNFVKNFQKRSSSIKRSRNSLLGEMEKKYEGDEEISIQNGVIVNEEGKDVTKEVASSVYADGPDYAMNQLSSMNKNITLLDIAKKNIRENASISKSIYDKMEDSHEDQKYLELEDDLGFVPGKAMFGDTYKDIKDDFEDTAKNTPLQFQVIIPHDDSSFLSEAGEPGQTMSFGDAYENLFEKQLRSVKKPNGKYDIEKLKNSEFFSQTFEIEEVQYDKRSESDNQETQSFGEKGNLADSEAAYSMGVVTVEDESGKEKEVRINIKKSNLKFSRSDLSIAEQKYQTTDGSANVAYTRVTHGNNTHNIMINADKSGFMNNKAKGRLNEHRQRQAGYLKMKNVLPESPVSSDGTVSNYLDGLSGEISFDGGRVEVLVEDGDLITKSASSGEQTISDPDLIKKVLNSLYMSGSLSIASD